MPPRDFPFTGKPVAWPHTTLSLQATVMRPDNDTFCLRLCPAPLEFVADLVGAAVSRLLVFDVARGESQSLFGRAHEAGIATEILSEDVIVIPGASLPVLLGAVQPWNICVVDAWGDDPAKLLEFARTASLGPWRPMLRFVPGASLIADCRDRLYTYTETRSEPLTLRLIDRFIRLRAAAVIWPAAEAGYVPPIPVDLLHQLLKPRGSIEFVDADTTVTPGTARFPIWGGPTSLEFARSPGNWSLRT